MEVKYIATIIIAGIFAMLFLVWLGTYFYNNHKAQILQKQIKAMYNDPGLAKMEFDFASYDDRVERIITASHSDGQLTIDDIMLESPAAAPDDGLEEITGNYKPE